MAASSALITFFCLVSNVYGYTIELDSSKNMEAFDAFIQSHGRSYKKGSAEYHRRLNHFNGHMSKVEQINRKSSRLWTAGASPLADLSEAEKKQKIGWFGSASSSRGHGPTGLLRGASFLNQLSSEEVKVPKEVSYANLQSLQDVPDQGSCGSCWAVASSTVLAANAEIYKSPQRTFSAEELVACVPNPRSCGGTGGCQGATVELAMNYTLSAGLATTSDFPYSAENEACKQVRHKATKGSKAALIGEGGILPSAFNANNANDNFQVGTHLASSKSEGLLEFRMSGWEKLAENKYYPLMRAVAERGPVAVSADASEWSLYSSGIFDSCKQDAVINHAITLIGYGEQEVEDTDSGKKELKKYWLIQNSWGNSFGENGRIRLLRRDNDEKNCGTDSQPEEGTGCKGGPASVKVCGMCGVLYDSVVPYFKKKK